MADADAFEALVDSYVATSPWMVRLAELAAPACRAEPQLLRRLRLACVPEADVSVEQELWSSELVNERGNAITFRDGVVQILRRRLKASLATELARVEGARRVTTNMHADLAPLLALEEQLAWAEVFGERATIKSAARTLVDSMRSRRDGLDYWLGRAWSGLPADLKKEPEGRALAQVAAARGAQVDAATTPAGVEALAHVLPLVALPLKLEGLRLEINVAPAAATHAIDVPQTQPRAIEVVSGSKTEQVVVSGAQTRTVQVQPGTVVLRTVSGTEYELDASAGSTTLLQLELVAVGHSTCVIIRYGDQTMTRLIVVDCGDRAGGRVLVDRLQAENRDDPIELLVLTHIDSGHIGGALTVLDSDLVRRIMRVWFNTPDQFGRGPSQKAS
jgi:hypothetical protein